MRPRLSIVYIWLVIAAGAAVFSHGLWAWSSADYAKYISFSIIALVGWVYVFVASGLSINGTQFQFILPVWNNPMILAIGWTVLGVVAYLLWARYVEHTWPFGPKEIKEEYVEQPVEEEVPA